MNLDYNKYLLAYTNPNPNVMGKLKQLISIIIGRL